MDNLIERLSTMTQVVIERIEETSYEELETFIEDRQHIVDAIIKESESFPLDVKQKGEVHRILAYDKTLLDRMNTLRIEAQDWLHKRNQAKMQRNVYETTYASDSMLMDRRK
ncbi:flagellar protein FliT [Paenibacillus sp. FSL H7-0942]|uniref:flagellar protein FliT n=1 Tax=Paenibacillus TaxID=44249 RepID=UPI0003E2A685|nr:MULTISPECIES: flagellar protein FliT [Paenibacillus]ETT48891.1 hypothetical protein C170_17907 [Paenibacillus sp. FSL H7-689]MCP1423333.1 hypothetical protein [Paenibacillus xylanexedens]